MEVSVGEVSPGDDVDEVTVVEDEEGVDVSEVLVGLFPDPTHAAESTTMERRRIRRKRLIHSPSRV
ncbi:hypothetical protein [Thermococcus celer]|uniref:hypothetical protein n=1 Tax=Thermococcus celer TaxID=2264 RepID=UPI0012FF6615|nr:hypothetical protein [Thermococcus celer]